MHADIVSCMAEEEKPAWTTRTDIWRDDSTDILADVRHQAQVWRSAYEATNDLSAELNHLILLAKQAGHSFSQLKEASGLGTGSLQLRLAKMGYRED